MEDEDVNRIDEYESFQISRITKSILVNGENARYLYSWTFSIESAAIYSTCDSFSIFSVIYGISSRRVSSTTEFRHNQGQ